ncbi:hypothetical protein HPB48_011811 [Haemaphysalis longicornis]|uniref:Reverse transcriptase domain-containing protein n=1 Tax=Haemaphysalis longicornis TaxID=44386 RepID=A0A9J6GXH7_HAELO|nr:hypothetical protein HPB48_011811 [Haemaphysalis longicornis]
MTSPIGLPKVESLVAGAHRRRQRPLQPQKFLPPRQTLRSTQLARRLPPPMSSADAATKGRCARPKTWSNHVEVPGQGEGPQLGCAGVTVQREPVANVAPTEYIVYAPKPNWKTTAWQRAQCGAFLSSSSEDDAQEEVDGPFPHTRGLEAPHRTPYGVGTILLLQTALRQDNVREGARHRWHHLRPARPPPSRRRLGSREGVIAERETDPSGAGDVVGHLVVRARPSCVLGSQATQSEVASPPKGGESSALFAATLTAWCESGQRLRGRAVEAASAYDRWTNEQLLLLARAEWQVPGNVKNINLALHPLYPTRSYDSIKSTRRTNRCRNILAEESRRATDITEIRHLLPVTVQELGKIYSHFGVKLKCPGKPRKEGDRVPRAPGESARSFKRRMYTEHQRLYSIWPRVLLEDLLAGSGRLGPVSLEAIHEVFDPILTDPSPSVRRVGVRAGSLREDAPLYVEREVAWALKNLQASTAPGPDSLTVRELWKVPGHVLVLVFNNWVLFASLPAELRSSRTVFIPKHAEAASASELGPLTISSLLVRTYSRLLLGRLQEEHAFHELQSGFTVDRAAQTNLLLLQGLMKDARRCNRAFYAASLYLRKADDSECSFVQASRCSRHNFMEAQVIHKLRKRHPDATVTIERLITDRDGVRLRPDIVLELPDRVHVIDVAVA